MSYNNGGFICFNNASHRGSGVYLKASGNPSNPTYLYFVVTGAPGEDLGLYSNEAFIGDMTTLGADPVNPQGAGDDIFAEGTSTKVVVPDISTMKLEGYTAPGVTLKWYEDYSYSDPNYTGGTNKGTAQRYRKERDMLHTIYSVDDIASVPAYQTKYLALTMGFEFKTLAIRRKELCPGEQAIYEITGPVIDGVPYRQRVVVYGTDATWDGITVDIKGLPAGNYTVTETSWTWYNQNGAGSITGPLTQSISEGNGTLFTFINSHPAVNDPATPKHDEKFKQNTLK